MEYQSDFFDDVKKMFAETDRRMQETDRRQQETARQMKETDRKLKEVGRQLGALGNRIGVFVQEMVKPGLVRLLRERGIDVHRTFPNIEVSRNGSAMEIDLLACNGDEVVVVEVKSKLETEDVKEHIERIGKFRRLFPEYKDHTILGAVAGMTVSENVAAFAEKSGFFVIAPSGEDVTFLNSTGFEPKTW